MLHSLCLKEEELSTPGKTHGVNTHSSTFAYRVGQPYRYPTAEKTPRGNSILFSKGLQRKFTRQNKKGKIMKKKVSLNSSPPHCKDWTQEPNSVLAAKCLWKDRTIFTSLENPEFNFRVYWTLWPARCDSDNPGVGFIWSKASVWIVNICALVSLCLVGNRHFQMTLVLISLQKEEIGQLPEAYAEHAHLHEWLTQMCSRTVSEFRGCGFFTLLFFSFFFFFPELCVWLPSGDVALDSGSLKFKRLMLSGWIQDV